MQNNKISLIILLAIFTSNITAQTIGCTHPQVCNMLNDLVLKTPVKLLKKITQDPHHDKLTAKELKQMLQSDILVLSPATLQPWSKKVANLRPDALILPLPITVPSLSAHALAHFWLYPPQITAITKWLSQQLTKLHIPHKNIAAPQHQLVQRLNRLKPCLQAYHVVLSHDALKALFHTYFPNTPLTILRKPGHFGTYSLAALKELKNNLTKQDKLVWINETNIHTPPTVIRWLAGAHQIKFTPLGKLGTTVQAPLLELITKLETLCQ